VLIEQRVRTYVDTFSETNPRFAALSRKVAAAGRTAGPGEAGEYDMGRLLAEGIARAPELTRPGYEPVWSG